MSFVVAPKDPPEDPGLEETMECDVPQVAEGPSRPKSRKAPPEPSYPYAEMSVFDDLCTDIILDKLHLGFITHKFKEGGVAAPLERAQGMYFDSSQSLDSIPLLPPSIDEILSLNDTLLPASVDASPFTDLPDDSFNSQAGPSGGQAGPSSTATVDKTEEVVDAPEATQRTFFFLDALKQ